MQYVKTIDATIEAHPVLPNCESNRVFRAFSPEDSPAIRAGETMSRSWKRRSPSHSAVFRLEYPGTDKWSSSDSGDLANMTGFMDRLYQKYVKKGIPVIIDEFGARDKNGNTAARADFAARYIAAAKERGMVCFWWDNNAFEGDGELFGILNRGKCEFAYPEIVDALIKSAED